MIIACPECKTRFVVAPAAIGTAGRRVRCSKCRALWFQDPPAEEMELVPETVLPPEEYPENVIKMADVEPGKNESPEVQPEQAEPPSGEESPMGIFGGDFSTNVPAVVEGRSWAAKIGWAIFIVVLLGGGFSLYYFRDWVESHSHAAAGLYQKWDVLVLGKHVRPQNAAQPSTILKPHPSSYLTLRQSPEIRFKDNVASLYVTMEIHNSADFDIALPPLHGVIRNSEGIEIFSWTQDVDPSVVTADGVLQFQAAVENIPADSVSAELTFDWSNQP